jgi:peroxiredoxin-like protein
METHTYSVNLSWLENRKGLLESSVLDEKIEVATPPEFTKGMARIWSPEHLFVAAASSCFMTTFLAIAEKSHLEFVSFHCSASGVLENTGEKMMITKVILKPTVIVAKKGDVEKCLRVLQMSHHNCLILHSMKSEVILMPHVNLWHEETANL